VTFNAPVPGVYRVRIGGVNGATGTGTMVITCTPSTCPADVTHDQLVDIDDLLFVLTHWGATGFPGEVMGDITHDGIVNIDDLLAVINGWGACP
jgi:hypothetical protein